MPAKGMKKPPLRGAWQRMDSRSELEGGLDEGTKVAVHARASCTAALDIDIHTVQAIIQCKCYAGASGAAELIN